MFEYLVVCLPFVLLCMCGYCVSIVCGFLGIFVYFCAFLCILGLFSCRVACVFEYFCVLLCIFVYLCVLFGYLLCGF